MAGRLGARTAGRNWCVPRRSQSAAPLPRVARSWLVLSAGGGLPVVWVPAVLAGAVQRPGREPAAVMNLKARRADHRSGRKIPPQVVPMTSVTYPDGHLVRAGYGESPPPGNAGPAKAMQNYLP